MSDIEIDFDDSHLVEQLREYVKELREEYDELRNRTRKVQAKATKVELDKEHVLFQVAENRQACAKLEAKRRALNQQYANHIDNLEAAERRRKSWTLVYNRTKHNKEMLQQRADMATQHLKKSDHGLQIAWKLAQQAKVKLDAAEAAKQALLKETSRARDKRGRALAKAHNQLENLERLREARREREEIRSMALAKSKKQSAVAAAAIKLVHARKTTRDFGALQEQHEEPLSKLRKVTGERDLGKIIEAFQARQAAVHEVSEKVARTEAANVNLREDIEKLKVAVTFEDADGSAAAEAAAAAGGSPKSPQRSSVANVCDALESSLRKARGGLNHIKRERSRVGSLIASLIGCVKKLLDQLEISAGREELVAGSLPALYQKVEEALVKKRKEFAASQRRPRLLQKHKRMSAPNIGIAAVEKLPNPFALEDSTDLATRQISTANSPTSGGNGSLAPNGVGNLRVKSDVMPRPSSARTRKIHRKTEDEQNRRKQQLLLQRLGQTSDVPGLAGEGSALGDEYSKQQDSAPFAGDAERTRLLYEDDESDDGFANMRVHAKRQAKQIIADASPKRAPLHVEKVVAQQNADERRAHPAPLPKDSKTGGKQFAAGILK